MECSRDTFSTVVGVPIECLAFVDVSGEERMSIGAGGSRRLGGWATPSRRRSAIFAAPYAPYPQVAYYYKDG
jgi:hypothetical protein